MNQLDQLSPNASASQQQQPPDIGEPDAEDAARRPKEPDQLTNPVGWLIYRVMFYTEEQSQDGPIPMAQKAATLAALYQAEALREIGEQLFAINENLAGIRLLVRDLDQTLRND